MVVGVGSAGAVFEGATEAVCVGKAIELPVLDAARVGAPVPDSVSVGHALGAPLPVPEGAGEDEATALPEPVLRGVGEGAPPEGAQLAD